MSEEWTAEQQIRCVIKRACAADEKRPHRIEPTGPNVLKNHWISSLHTAFEEHYKLNWGQDARLPQVFSAGRPIEMGYDLLVVETDGSAGSPRRTVDVDILKQPLWQVESEINTNGRLVANDLNKLVIGSAPNKLLVTCFRDDVEKFNRFIACLCRHCTGTLFVAYIPSYSRKKDACIWMSGSDIPFGLYRFYNGESAEIGSSSDWQEHLGNRNARRRLKRCLQRP